VPCSCRIRRRTASAARRTVRFAAVPRIGEASVMMEATSFGLAPQQNVRSHLRAARQSHSRQGLRAAGESQPRTKPLSRARCRLADEVGVIACQTCTSMALPFLLQALESGIRSTPAVSQGFNANGFQPYASQGLHSTLSHALNTPHPSNASGRISRPEGPAEESISRSSALRHFAFAPYIPIPSGITLKSDNGC